MQHPELKGEAEGKPLGRSDQSLAADRVAAPKTTPARQLVDGEWNLNRTDLNPRVSVAGWCYPRTGNGNEMARLSKVDLLRQVENGFEAGGWTVLHLTAAGEHPARYRISLGDLKFTVCTYIWNITHGGGPRNATEYRIQITGLRPNRFVPELGSKTLVLGYWENEGVFAGFDLQFHARSLGGSPSFQVGEAALLDANQQRFAVHRKNNGELVIAFRADFIGNYVEHLEALHAIGRQPAEVDFLSELAENPDALDYSDIEAAIADPRRHAIVQTRRALRALDFSDRVLTAYSHQCAICGIQLRLLDGAHILPVSESGSTDETSNGVALCTLHHRAYDRGLITFDREYRVHLNNRRVRALVDAGRDGKLPEFKAALRRTIHLPPDRRDRPDQGLVGQANVLRGWEL